MKLEPVGGGKRPEHTADDDAGKMKCGSTRVLIRRNLNETDNAGD